MSKLLVLLLAVAVVGLPAYGQVKLKDVPDDHWAASAVYDLVKMGVTKGYPDGTFRGNKTITRYETAVFLSKLAKAAGAEDLRADIKALKSEIVELKKGGALPLSGSYLASWKGANLLASKGGTRGAIGSYRLILTSSQNLGEGASVKVNLDTMDYGYNVAAAGGILASQLLDIESTLKLDLSWLELGLDNPVDLRVAYGPGAQQHTDPTGALPSETGIVYQRPDPAVMASTTMWGAEVSGGYIAKSLQDTTTGKVDVSQLSGTVGYGFSNVPLLNALKVAITADYISQGLLSQANRDIRGKIALFAPLTEKIRTSGTIGLGSSVTKGMMVSGILDLDDIWNSGTIATINVNRIGSDYIPDVFQAVLFDEAGLDIFSRPLTEGTWNIGGVVTQNVVDKVKLVGKGDIRLSGDLKYANTTVGRLTAQGGVLYDIAPNSQLDASYRIHQDKSTGDTSDVALLGLQYKF